MSVSHVFESKREGRVCRGTAAAFLSGFAAGSLIIRLYSSEALIRHTYDVEVALGDLETSLTSVGRSRVAYINSGSAESLRDYTDAARQVGVVVARIRQLTNDNPAQQKLCDQLAANANERIAVAPASVDLRTQNRSDPEKQFELTAAVAKATFDTAAITQQMRANEDALLQERSRLSQLLFAALPGILAVSFALSALMFWLHYYMLNRELQERRGAENQLRRLSMQLMRVQDEERRRFARELHDELGQTSGRRENDGRRFERGRQEAANRRTHCLAGGRGVLKSGRSPISSIRRSWRTPGSTPPPTG